MSRFNRSGHWRVSKYGHRHWVTSHSVDRYDWGGRGEPPLGWFEERTLRVYNAAKGWTATFVNPNAHCPVCNAPVFFYQNERGSRVYFDEMGPPWPKHPCTNMPDVRSGKSVHRGEVPVTVSSPELRPSEDIDTIANASAYLDLDRAADFAKIYQSPFWTPLRVTKAYRNGDACLVVAVPCIGEKVEPIYLEFDSSKNLVREGSILFRRMRRISVFDADDQVPRKFVIKTFQSPQDFLERIPSNL